jgi:hypothetical protein
MADHHIVFTGYRNIVLLVGWSEISHYPELKLYVNERGAG